MAGLLGSLHRWKIVEDVTSNKDEVAPLYLMKEIADLTKESSEQGIAIAEHVNNRLQNKSPFVKQKALRLVKYLSTEGSISFRKCMQQHAATIRELEQFKGEPDPFKGDAPAKYVRELAKEALESLYNTSMPSMAAGGTLKGRIQGFGSTMPPPPGTAAASAPPRPTGNPYSSSSNGGGKISSSRMMGFGNAAFDNPPPPPPSSTSSVGVLGSDYGRPAAGVSLANRGTGSFGRPVIGDPPPRSAPEPHSASSNPIVGSEQILLDTLTQPGGVRSQPPKEDLQHFVEATSGMDGLKMGELMLEKLHSNNWQVVLRTLCALEAILENGMTQACGEIAVMFQSDPTTIQAAQTSTQPSVRDKATKCLKKLVAETGEHVDMLGVSDSTPAPKLPPPPPATVPLSASSKPPPNKDPFDLLGDLEPSLPPSGPAQPATGTSAQPQPTTAPAAPTPAPASDPTSLFDPFTPSTPTPPSSNPTPAPPPAPTQPHPPPSDPFAVLSSSPPLANGSAPTNPTPSPPTPAQAAQTASPAGAPPPQQPPNQPNKPAPPPPLDDFFAAPMPQPQGPRPMAPAGMMPGMLPGAAGMPGMAPGGVPAGMMPGMRPGMPPGGAGMPGMAPGGVPAGMMPGMRPGMPPGGPGMMPGMGPGMFGGMQAPGMQGPGIFGGMQGGGMPGAGMHAGFPGAGGPRPQGFMPGMHSPQMGMHPQGLPGWGAGSNPGGLMGQPTQMMGGMGPTGGGGGGSGGGGSGAHNAGKGGGGQASGGADNAAFDFVRDAFK